MVTDKNAKVNKVKSPKGGSDANGDLFSILPDRNKQAAAGESLYDFDDDDDDDDDFLGAGIKNLSNIDEESPEEIAKKKAEEEARKDVYKRQLRIRIEKSIFSIYSSLLTECLMI